MATRCHMAAIERGSTLSTLLPREVQHWLPMLEGVAFSEAFSDKLGQMTEALEERDEWHFISMDATVKVCLKLLGQESYRASKDTRNAAPFGDDTAWRRLLTVRGRTGAVLLLHPLQDESATQIVDALSTRFTSRQLSSIVHIATDSPSEKLFTELKAICPAMKSLMLDPIHLAIVEYGFWNKKSTGSKQLRKILRKCTCTDRTLPAHFLGTWYDGSGSRPLTKSEKNSREQIITFGMCDDEVPDVLDNMDTDVPFTSRSEIYTQHWSIVQAL